MFNFLNPTVLFALAAGLIPLIIHLLNRKKVKLIPFSSIHFLKKMQQREIRRLRLRQLLLLILRTLIILLIVLAFARPTLQRGSGIFPRRSSTEAVIIIDNSLSLNSVSLTGSLLEKVRQRWIQLEPLFKSGDRITVLLGVQPLQFLARSEPYSAQLWQKVTKEIQPGYWQQNLSGALRQAVVILKRSEFPNREIYLLSDFQKNESLPTDLFPGGTGGKTPPIKLFCLPVPQTSEENLSLDSAWVENRLIEKMQPFRVEAVVHNRSTEKYLNSLISLVLNGNRVAQKNVDLAPGTQQTVAFQVAIQQGGWVTGMVESEDDPLMEDNRYFFNFFVPENVRVLHLTSAPGKRSFVPLVLEPAIGQGLFQLTRAHIADWSRLDFNEFDVVILEADQSLPEGLFYRLQQQVQRGGGLVILPGENIVPATMNNLLERFKIGKILSRNGTPGDTRTVVSLGRVDWSHPIFEGLFEKNRMLNPIDFAAYYRLKPASSARIIMRLANGDPLLIEQINGGGSVYLFAAPLNLDWSNLPTRGFVIPLFYRLVYYPAIRKVQERMNITVGYPFAATVRSRAVSGGFVLQRPDGVEEKIDFQARGNEYFLNFKQNPLPGNYRVLAGNQTVLVYSVNVSPRESVAEYFSRSDLERVDPQLWWIEPSREVAKVVIATRYGVELWTYLLLAAFVLLLLEMLVAYTASRREQPPPGELEGASTVN